MRNVPEPRIKKWEPPKYVVDENGKVVGAKPGPHNNWGRFGDDDQLGCANFLTDDRVAAAAALIRTGKRFSLGLPIGGIVTPGYRAAPLHFMKMVAGDGVLGDSLGGLQGSDDYMVLALQATTQLDALSHIGRDEVLYNGFWSGLVTARSGARRLGIHHFANGIVGRAVVLDVGRHCGDGILSGGFAIGPEQLDAACAAEGVDVQAGDILLVRTGWLGDALRRGVEKPSSEGEPGMSPSAIPWLAERDVTMVATDTMTCEVVPFEDGYPPLSFHVGALRDLGLLLGELFDLDELAADCENDGAYACFFSAMPLPVVSGVGSPLNPVVIK
jgi:kynurenine formamidase